MIKSTAVVTNVDDTSSSSIDINVSTIVVDAIIVSVIVSIKTTSKTISEIVNFRFNLRFKYRNDLIYYVFENERERFCVSTSLKQKMFQLIHDQTHHDDFHKIYDRIISSIYIHQLIKRLRIYIVHCSKCQLNQTKRHFIYEKFTSLITFIILFHTIFIN